MGNYFKSVLCYISVLRWKSKYFILINVKLDQEKLLRVIKKTRWLVFFYTEPYLKTNTSKLVEYTKAFEWSIIKELGKMTRVTSG
jgi:hypothetical protein